MKKLSEDCDYRAVVGVGNKLLNLIGLEGVYESGCLVGILVAVSYRDDVSVGLRCGAGSVLNCESIVDIKTCRESVVAVDYGKGACVAVVELRCNGVCLNGGNLESVVVNNVEGCNAVNRIRALGKRDKTLLREKQQRSCFVAVVRGDNNACALCNISDAFNAVSVQTKRLVVNQRSGNKVGSVCGVYALLLIFSLISSMKRSRDITSVSPESRFLTETNPPSASFSPMTSIYGTRSTYCASRTI